MIMEKDSLVLNVFQSHPCVITMSLTLSTGVARSLHAVTISSIASYLKKVTHRYHIDGIIVNGTLLQSDYGNYYLSYRCFFNDRFLSAFLGSFSYSWNNIQICFDAETFKSAYVGKIYSTIYDIINEQINN